MTFPEIDALARTARGPVPSPRDPQLAGLLEGMGLAGDQQALAARDALLRWSDDPQLTAAERDYARLRLAELPAA